MKRNGTTLIETVAVMLLLGILALAVVLAVVPVTRGLLLARGSVDASQKSHLAMSRLVREFTLITNVVSGTQQSLTYSFVDSGGAAHQRTVNGIAGGPLLLDGVPLTDDVAAFELRYYATPGGAAQTGWSETMRLVEFILQPASIPAITYTNRVYLRWID